MLTDKQEELAKMIAEDKKVYPFYAHDQPLIDELVAIIKHYQTQGNTYDNHDD